MANRLYIGNLPYDIDENRLLQIFQEWGFTPSRPHVVIDRDTGRPKGFAFIELATQDEAQNAVAQMNGQNIDGRAVKIDHAVERSSGDKRW